MMNKTHITLIVDRSGSMSNIKNDAEGGINQLIKDHSVGDCTLSLCQFDTVYEEVFSGDIKKCKTYNLMPRGGTALMDAIGRGINETGSFLSNMKDKPDLVLFAIITDGQENSSREFTSEKIKEMIKHQTDVYSWKFEFLCADADTALQGNELGFASSTQYNTVNTQVTYKKMSEKFTRARSLVANGGSAASVNMAYTEEEVKEMNE